MDGLILFAVFSGSVTAYVGNRLILGPLMIRRGKKKIATKKSEIQQLISDGEHFAKRGEVEDRLLCEFSLSKKEFFKYNTVSFADVEWKRHFNYLRRIENKIREEVEQIREKTSAHQGA